MNEYVNQAMIMIQKVIAAATPIAQKAYEIALLTLQIDALSVIIPAVGAVLLSVVLFKVLWKGINKKIMAAREETTMSQPFDKGDWWRLGVILSVVSSIPGIIGVCHLMHVWLWVKLFRPELWLAHMAIEKLIK